MYHKNRKEQKEQMSELTHGKIPPQARELEECVIGALLIDNNAISEVSDLLQPDSFYVDANAIIYGAIQQLYRTSSPVDILTVTEHLRKEGKLESVGGAYYISELTNKVASSSNIEFHARIIMQKAIQRELIKISNDIVNDAYEDTVDVFDLLSMAEIKMDAIKSNIYGSSVCTALTVWDKSKKDIITPPTKPLSVPSILGIRHDLGTIDAFGAKPGTGKTAVMIQGSVEAVKQGYKAGILSLELGNRLLVSKLIHHMEGVSAKKIIRNELSDYEKEKLFRKNEQHENILKNIFIDDKGCNSLNIRSKIITLVKKYGCEIVWIDYIQLVSIYTQKGQNDTKAMEVMMSVLQQTAKELDICIIVLSQLTRGGDVPSMEELRGGGVEQACSKIILLHDENYKKNAGKPFLEITEDRGKLILIDDKERFDDKHNITAYYDKIAQTFSFWDERDTNAYSNEIKSQIARREQEEIERKQKEEQFDIF